MEYERGKLLEGKERSYGGTEKYLTQTKDSEWGSSVNWELKDNEEFIGHTEEKIVVKRGKDMWGPEVKENMVWVKVTVACVKVVTVAEAQRSRDTV